MILLIDDENKLEPHIDTQDAKALPRCDFSCSNSDFLDDDKPKVDNESSHLYSSLDTLHAI